MVLPIYLLGTSELRKQTEDVEMTLTTQERGPSGRIEGQEWLRAARTAIHRLDDGEKEVFLLRVSGDRTFEAIAAALSIPVGTAKTRMRSALKKLRLRLSRFEPTTSRGARPVREDS